MNIIEIKDLNRYFGESENRVHILKNVSLNIEKGDFVAIIEIGRASCRERVLRLV